MTAGHLVHTPLVGILTSIPRFIHILRLVLLGHPMNIICYSVQVEHLGLGQVMYKLGEQRTRQNGRSRFQQKLEVMQAKPFAFLQGRAES